MMEKDECGLDKVDVQDQVKWSRLTWELTV